MKNEIYLWITAGELALIADHLPPLPPPRAPFMAQHCPLSKISAIEERREFPHPDYEEAMKNHRTETQPMA